MSFTLLGILNAQAAGAGGVAAYDLLETEILASDAASVTFTGLGSYTDYKHLQIRAVVRDTLSGFSAPLGSLKFYFNGDQTASYSFHNLAGNGTSVFSSQSSSVSDITLLETAPTNDSSANIYGAAVVDILDFSSSSKNTTTRSLSGANTSAESQINLGSGGYFKTDSITSISFFNEFFTFETGSRFSLYGIRA